MPLPQPVTAVALQRSAGKLGRAAVACMQADPQKLGNETIPIFIYIYNICFIYIYVYIICICIYIYVNVYIYIYMIFNSIHNIFITFVCVMLCFFLFVSHGLCLVHTSIIQQNTRLYNGSFVMFVFILLNRD